MGDKSGMGQCTIKDLEIYDLLFKKDGWYFMRNKELCGGKEFNFIIHTNCPRGLNDAGGGSIMSIEFKMCQACGQRPPVAVMGAYIIHRWDR